MDEEKLSQLGEPDMTEKPSFNDTKATHNAPNVDSKIDPKNRTED